MKPDAARCVAVAVAAWLSLTAAAPAGEPAPPPSPAFKPVAGALFADDFSSDSLKGWRADSAGVWSVHGGVLRGELPDIKQAHSFLFAGDSTWSDYAVDLDVCGMRGVDKGVGVRVQREHKKGLGVDLRAGGHDDVLLYATQFPVGSGKAANANGAWHHMRVEIRGVNACMVAIDGRTVFEGHLKFHAPPRGGIGLAAYAGGVGQCTVYYDNVIVTPLTTGSK